MTIQRNPHPVFLALWLAWLLNVYVAIGRPQWSLYGLLVLLSFLAIEIPAAATKTRGNARDTLSEISTWVQKRVSHHNRFARGWNAALLAGLILPVAWLLMRTVNHYAETPILGTLMGGLCVVYLWDHFSDPVTHG